MTVITVFRRRLRHGVDDAYDELSRETGRLERDMPGFVDESAYRGDDGERVNIVRFCDAATQRAWARHPDHAAVQARGRADVRSPTTEPWIATAAFELTMHWRIGVQERLHS